MICWCSSLTGKPAHVGPGDGFGRWRAASAASFLPRLPPWVGVTNLGAMSLTVWPLTETISPSGGRWCRFPCRSGTAGAGRCGPAAVCARHFRFDNTALLFHRRQNRKDVLGEIDTYRHNAHGLPLSWLPDDRTSPFWHLLPVASPQPRDGGKSFHPLGELHECHLQLALIRCAKS